MRGYIGQIKDRQQSDLDPLREQLRDMNAAHRDERQRLKEGQDKRWAEETKLRSNRLNKGLRGLFDRLSGTHKAVQDRNAKDALACSKRDQKQRDFMVSEQIKDRRALQREFQKLRRKHADERKRLASNIRHSLKTHTQNQDNSRHHKRGPDLSPSL